MGQTDLILVFLGFMIFIWFLYMTFLFAKFFWFLLNVYTHMCVFTVVYYSHICYESHPSCYFDCAYIGVSEGDMRDDSLATIGSQFPIYIIILFIPLS